MLKKLEYSTPHKILVSVSLYDRITIIGGDSSTGKSFIKETSQEFYNDEEKTLIEVFDYRRTVDLAVLRALKNRLIIIDNADVILDGKDAICEHINSDSANMYLLFMRSENGIDVSIDNYAELKLIENVLTTEYEYR